MTKRSSLRILQVVSAMSRGGAETWLMHVLRHIDRERFHMDFLVHTTRPGAYDSEIRALGSRIIPCPFPHRPLVYARNFGEALREYGPYDVVHSHVYLFSGLVLCVARRHGVVTRIANIYPTRDEQAQTHLGQARFIYRWLMARCISGNASCVLFDSPQAREAFVNIVGKDLASFRVLHCGIDLAPFQKAVSAARVREELEIPLDAKVVMTVARYVPHKNHRHLVEIARRIIAIRDDVIFLSVGDGPLYSEIRELISDFDLDAKFRLIRGLPDIAPLYKSADLFLFPSLMEGFGLVIVEAAASGLPIIASRIPGIVNSAQASPAAVLISPDDTEGFVAAVLDSFDQPKARYSPDPLLLAPFDILASITNLANIYKAGCQWQ